MTRILHHLKQVGIAIDQLFNALTGGFADETLSSRCWRHRRLDGWKQLRIVLDIIFFWDMAHCRESFESEWKAHQLPPALRQYRLNMGVGEQ